jgi:hypothetical protein
MGPTPQVLLYAVKAVCTSLQRASVGRMASLHSFIRQIHTLRQNRLEDHPTGHPEWPSKLLSWLRVEGVS